MNAEAQPITDRARTLRDLVAEIVDELTSFVSTRIDLAHAELSESWTACKSAMPFGLVAVAFGAVAWVLFSLAVVCIVSFAFGQNPLKWFFSFLVVAVIWALVAGICAYFAVHKLRSEGTFPRKTFQVLKADEEWLKHEVRRTA